jgi:hypothetical protein
MIENTAFLRYIFNPLRLCRNANSLKRVVQYPLYKKSDGDIRLYFVVETKYGKEWNGLTPVEQEKIKFGRLHFKAVLKVSNERIDFLWANSYLNLKMRQVCDL